MDPEVPESLEAPPAVSSTEHCSRSSSEGGPCVLPVPAYRSLRPGLWGGWRLPPRESPWCKGVGTRYADTLGCLLFVVPLTTLPPPGASHLGCSLERRCGPLFSRILCSWRSLRGRSKPGGRGSSGRSDASRSSSRFAKCTTRTRCVYNARPCISPLVVIHAQKQGDSTIMASV
jgi:hypothetical protein